MKKVFIIILILLILFILGFTYISDTSNTLSDEISTEIDQAEKEVQENLLSIILPDIEEYCQELDDIFKDSSCPVCRFYHTDEPKINAFKYLNELDYNEINLINHPNHAYTLIEEGDNNRINVKMHIVIGGYNNKPAKKELSFLVDKNGDVIQKDIPEAKCLT